MVPGAKMGLTAPLAKTCTHGGSGVHHVLNLVAALVYEAAESKEAQ